MEPANSAAEIVEKSVDDKQSLEKAVQKTIDNGWDMFGTRKESLPAWLIVSPGDKAPIKIPGFIPSNSLFLPGKQNRIVSNKYLIFHPKFTEALWGKEAVAVSDTKTIPENEYHAEQMAQAADPIQYLADNSEVTDVL